MNEREMVPALLLRVDNLLQVFGTLSSELAESRDVDRQVLSRLENIERSLSVPLVYTVRQAAKRLGMSVDWGYRHLDKLVTPLSRDPLRFRVAEIEALACSRSKRKRAVKEEMKAG